MHVSRRQGPGRLFVPAAAITAMVVGMVSIGAGQDTRLPLQEAPPLPPVTSQDLRDGLTQPGRWLMYSGDYTGRRHSPLTQITPDNARQLAPRWTFQAEGMAISRGWESTPLVHDGVMYVTGNGNLAWAVDVRTGRQIWRYRRRLPSGLTYGGGNPTNRGFAILGDRLFMGTLDAHLVALDRNSGAELWDVELDDFRLGHAVTHAPLVVKDMVIVGNAGGDIPSRGFIDAIDAATGKRVWRFWTIPAAGEPGSETWSDPDVLPRGGGAAWQSGSYDPDLNLIYWGVGNPNPDYYGADRQGDNLYTASIVALDADTGTLRWHFQFTPHDLHDWDSNHVPVLADLEIDGRQRRVVMVANRNSFFYVLDRETGEFLLGKPFNGTQWARELDAEGRPIVLSDGAVLPGQSPDNVQCVPDLRGGTNFNPPSYDPDRRLFFVMARETCAIYTPRPMDFQIGRVYMSGGMQKLPEPDYGALRALDPTTGEMVWEHRLPTPSLAGVMSTASGVVFAGDNEGNFNAFEAWTGRQLWSYRMGSLIWGAGPVSYMLDGRQYVLLPSGNTLTAFGLPE